MGYSVAQQGPQMKSETYRAWVSLFDSHSAVEGILYEARDSSIVLMLFNEDVPLDFELAEFEINDIVRVQTRNANVKPVVGALVGGAIGLAAGILISKPSEKCGMADPFCTDKKGTANTYGGVFGAILGAGVGLAIVGPKVTIPIRGRMDNYNRYKDQLIKRSRKERQE
jgi:hypothetical protein